MRENHGRVDPASPDASRESRHIRRDVQEDACAARCATVSREDGDRRAVRVARG